MGEGCDGVRSGRLDNFFCPPSLSFCLPSPSSSATMKIFHEKAPRSPPLVCEKRDQSESVIEAATVQRSTAPEHGAMASRWGILGCGKISSDFTNCLKHNGSQVVACASRTLQSSEAFAKKHKIDKAHGSYQDLFADEDVTIVYIGNVHVSRRDVPQFHPSLVSMACSNTTSSLSLCAVPFLLENTIYLSTFSRDRRTTVWQWRRRLGPASTSCARSPWVRQCGNLPLAGTDSLTGDPPPLLSLSLSVELGKE